MSKPNYLSKTIAKGEAVWSALKLVQDNWQNVFTGLGTARDKTVFGSFVRLQEITENELTALYHQNDTARKVVALKPQEMMRQGFAVNIEDDTDDKASDLGQSLRDLEAGVKVRDAMIWGRLYGGAAVIIGADDSGEAAEPLNMDRIATVRFLHVVDKRYLMPESYFDDPLNDKHYGEPATYRVVTRRGASNFVVHRSRLLLFGGAHTSDEERDKLGSWDHSVIVPMYDVLRMFDSVWKSAEHLMSDASQAVFKIQGLMSMIAGGQKEALQTRMQLVDMSRSVARALLLDADGGEDFSRQPSSFTDAQSMLDKFMMRLSSAVDIPVTILMGRSPAGQNATGESDFRWFYDTVRTSQENELKPQLETLVRIMLRAKDSPTGGKEPDVWSIQFAPLWQNTPSEQANLEKTTAEKDKIYIDAGVVLPEEIATSRFKPDGWSAETSIDADARKGMLEAEATLPTDPKDPDADVEDEPVEDEPETTGGNVVLAPTDIAVVVTVNEARASQGLPDWPDAAEGKLTVAEFKARKEAEGAEVGTAEGEAEAEEINPESDDEEPATSPPFGGSPFGGPPEIDEPEDDTDGPMPPAGEPPNEPDDEE